MPEDNGYSGTSRRVLESSVELFAGQGYNGTSMRDIAQAVGLRAASIYEHFASKGHILAAVATIGHGAVRDAVADALAEVGDDPVHQMQVTVEALVHVNCRWRELAVVINNDLRSVPADLAGPPTERRDEVALRLADIIHRGQQDATFAPRNLVVLVASIGGMCIRAPYWFEPTEGYQVDDLARDYAELAVAMLRAPTPAS